MPHSTDALLTDPISRRTALRGVGLAGLAVGLPLTLPARSLARQLGSTPTNPPASKRVLRVAHITDVHVQPELKAGVGFSDCLARIGRLKDQPDVIFNTGDCV